jgi:hypothetical protein
MKEKTAVNDLGGIYRLDGGIVEVTLIKKFDESLTRLFPIEQVTIIWPEHRWLHYAEMLHWVQNELARGTFQRDLPQLRPH